MRNPILVKIVHASHQLLEEAVGFHPLQLACVGRHQQSKEVTPCTELHDEAQIAAIVPDEVDRLDDVRVIESGRNPTRIDIAAGTTEDFDGVDLGWRFAVQSHRGGLSVVDDAFTAAIALCKGCCCLWTRGTRWFQQGFLLVCLDSLPVKPSAELAALVCSEIGAQDVDMFSLTDDESLASWDLHVTTPREELSLRATRTATAEWKSPQRSQTEMVTEKHKITHGDCGRYSCLNIQEGKRLKEGSCHPTDG